MQAVGNASCRILGWLAQATQAAVVDLVPASYDLGDRALYTRAVAASLEVYLRTDFSPMEGEAALKLPSLAELQITAAKIDLAATFDDSFLREAQKHYGA